MLFLCMCIFCNANNATYNNTNTNTITYIYKQVRKKALFRAFSGSYPQNCGKRRLFCGRVKTLPYGGWGGCLTFGGDCHTSVRTGSQ